MLPCTRAQLCVPCLPSHTTTQHPLHMGYMDTYIRPRPAPTLTQRAPLVLPPLAALPALQLLLLLLLLPLLQRRSRPSLLDRVVRFAGRPRERQGGGAQGRYGRQAATVQYRARTYRCTCQHTCARCCQIHSRCMRTGHILIACGYSAGSATRYRYRYMQLWIPPTPSPARHTHIHLVAWRVTPSFLARVDSILQTEGSGAHGTHGWIIARWYLVRQGGATQATATDRRYGAAPPARPTGI